MSKLYMGALVLALSMFANSAHAKWYGAFAAGIYEDDENLGVSVATAAGESQAEADAKAIEACTNSNVPRGCQVLKRWEKGCYYAAMGTRQRPAKVGWGDGFTLQAALAACRAQGLQCSENSTAKRTCID